MPFGMLLKVFPLILALTVYSQRFQQLRGECKPKFGDGGTGTPKKASGKSSTANAGTPGSASKKRKAGKASKTAETDSGNGNEDISDAENDAKKVKAEEHED